jgi:ACR3 family arsenite transporter
MATEVSSDSPPQDAVVARLSLLDRFLPVWIALAMVTGILLGKAFTGLDERLDAVKIDTVSLPIAIGLFAMMYPVLAKVKYRSIGTVIERRSLVMSLVLNWVIGPLLMFTLAWLLLPDLPEYRTGLIIVGLARCIAMVLIWNDLACGSRELAAVLVAINSLFQIAAYALLGYFYLELLPGWLGLDSDGIDVTVWEITKSVLIFLGIPLLAGFLTRTILERRRGTPWYEEVFLPRIGPIALYGLLFTIVVLFALQGDASPMPRSTSPASPSPSSSTSASCGPARLLRGSRWVSRTTATLRSRSPRRATTSNSRSPWPSVCSGCRQARHSPVSSAP